MERSIASARWGRGEKRDSFWLALIWVTTIRLNFPIWLYRDVIAIVSHSCQWQFSCLILPPEKSWPFMGYRAEHFYYETRNRARLEKLAGQGIHHARRIMRTYLQFCHQFLNLFKKETVLLTNFFNLCPSLLTELCLAKSCFISLIHLSKRIWDYMDKLILECLCQCILNRRIRNCQLYRNFYPSSTNASPRTTH